MLSQNLFNAVSKFYFTSIVRALTTVICFIFTLLLNSTSLCDYVADHYLKLLTYSMPAPAIEHINHSPVRSNSTFPQHWYRARRII